MRVFVLQNLTIKSSSIQWTDGDCCSQYHTTFYQRWRRILF